MTPSTSVQAYNRIIALHFPSSAEWVLCAHKDNYKIIAIDGCALVFGSLPPSALERLLKLVPKKSVVDSYVARIAGANLAAGMPNDLKLLAERLKPEAIRRLREELGETNLSDAALTWLAVGERGACSEAMFYRLTGVLPSGMEECDPTCHPHDAADFARCRKLIEQVPELAQRIAQMATVSPAWSRLIQSWELLSATMDEENPMWRDRTGNAPKTCEMIDEAIDEP